MKINKSLLRKSSEKSRKKMAGILQLTLPREEPKRGRGRPRTPPEVIAERQRLAAQQQTALITNPVDQARAVFRSGNRLSALVGLIMGGFVPLASYALIHLEVGKRPTLWVLVAGGLVYSALNMFGWMQRLFGNRWMALGWVVLLEGTMTACSIAWLSLTGLSILMILDGITTAITITLQKPREE
jgi:hypothetical protein